MTVVSCSILQVYSYALFPIQMLLKVEYAIPPAAWCQNFSFGKNGKNGSLTAEDMIMKDEVRPA